MKKIPLFTGEELIKLGKVMYFKDDLSKKRFWKNIHEKRGLEYK